MTMRQSLAFGVLATLIAIPAWAQGPSPRTLAVSGHGEANAAPDSAMISAGVTTQAATAAEALASIAKSMTRVFAALTKLGVEKKNIQTTNFGVSPQYAPYNTANTDGQRITGYLVSNQVNVTLAHIAEAGPAIDALVEAGANQMSGINFTIHDPKPLLAQARAAAVDDAVARAQMFAKAAHVGLGPILSIDEGNAEAPRPIYPMRAMAANAVAPTPIATGEQTVTADVTIVWQIK